MNIINQTETLSAFENQAQVFRALAHPVRLLILYALRDGEHCVCHLEAHLGLRQAYLSQQLGELRRAGLVALRRDGRNRYYRITRPEIFNVVDESLVLLPEGELQFKVSPNPDCPCPCCAARRERAAK